MRYKLSEQTYIITRMETGLTVTIALYNLSNNNTVPLSSNSMSEVGTTGVYKWHTSNITTQPTQRTEYLWVATANNGLTSYGKLVLGGYPDEVGETSQKVWQELTTTNWGTNSMGEKLKSLEKAKKIKLIVDGEKPIYEP